MTCFRSGKKGELFKVYLINQMLYREYSSSVEELERNAKLLIIFFFLFPNVSDFIPKQTDFSSAK